MVIEQNAVTPRRKRAILYCAADPGVTSSVLHNLADETRVPLTVCGSTQEFTAALSSAGDAVCLVAIDVGFSDVTSAARIAAERLPMCEIAVLASERDRAEVGRRLGPAPRVGSHMHYISPTTPGLGKMLRSLILRSDQRRMTRTTLDRFNARLTVRSEAVDTGEMRQLVISDSFLYSVLESAFDAVLLVDRAGIVVTFNPSAERLFERPRERAISHALSSLGGERWRADTEKIGDLIRSSELIHSVVEVGRETKHVEISATPVYDRSHALVATSLIVRDVTARIRTEDALRMNEKLAAVGRMASSIAHEINNPLEAVTNLLYLARGSEDLRQVYTYLDTAEMELARVSAIASQTLRFHRQSTSPTTVRCEDLLESAIGVYQGRLGNSQILLERRFRATRAISCMEGEIRQVLHNLAGNAIDAMARSGGRLLLRTRNGRDWKMGVDGVVITVADTGSGMTAETVGKIFEPFFTTKGMSGTGLGLWISSEIVLRHHGCLRVRSRHGTERSGTVFTLFLPC